QCATETDVHVLLDRRIIRMIYAKIAYVFRKRRVLFVGHDQGIWSGVEKNFFAHIDPAAPASYSCVPGTLGFKCPNDWHSSRWERQPRRTQHTLRGRGRARP